MTSERRLDIDGTDGPIPAVLWQPTEADQPSPLVLAGHGGGGHKSDGFVSALRDRLIPRGIAVAAIDAVGHGARASTEPAATEVLRVISEDASYDEMIDDWRTALDALLETGDFTADAVAYAGLSGGSLFGLPFVAAERRISAAVLGACGIQGAPLLGDAPSTFGPRLRESAHRWDGPTLFLLQTDDDFFPPTGGRALFEEIASTDKRLIESPGTHTEVPVTALDEAARWLGTQLSSR